MKSKSVKVMLAILTAAFILSGCGKNNSSSVAETTSETTSSEAASSESETLSEEDFKKKYDEIMDETDQMNDCSHYVGITQAYIWSNTGSEKVVEAIQAVRTYGDDNEGIVINAFDLNPLANKDTDEYKAAKDQAFDYAETYNTALSKLKNLSVTTEELYRSLNDSYGSMYNLDDLKEYYIESASYADYASDIEGSYVSYSQTLDDYDTNIAKLKKAAELAY